MKPSKIYTTFLLSILLSFTLGCLAWEPGWKLAQAPAAKGDVKALLDKAKKLESVADTKEKVQQLIAAYEDAAKVDPQNVEALNSLGGYYLLLSYAYSENKADKKSNYVKAIQNSERAMYTNPGFKALADKGENAWDACRVLKKHDLSAMYRWYLSVSNCWNECYGIFGKLINFSWTGRGKKVQERMNEIDPAWNNGSVYFCSAARYAILPGMMGGDMKTAEEHFNKALSLGPHMTNFYVVRAIYYQTKQKDRNAFVADLHHAIAIDPHHADTLSYPWAAWYQVKAKQLLMDTDKYFK